MKSRNAVMNEKGGKPDVTEEDMNGGPSPAAIRQRAFEIHTEHGGIHGRDLDDWLQAERELQEDHKNREKRAKRN